MIDISAWETAATAIFGTGSSRGYDATSSCSSTPATALTPRYPAGRTLSVRSAGELVHDRPRSVASAVRRCHRTAATTPTVAATPSRTPPGRSYHASGSNVLVVSRPPRDLATVHADLDRGRVDVRRGVNAERCEELEQRGAHRVDRLRSVRLRDASERPSGDRCGQRAQRSIDDLRCAVLNRVLDALVLVGRCHGVTAGHTSGGGSHTSGASTVTTGFGSPSSRTSMRHGGPGVQSTIARRCAW